METSITPTFCSPAFGREGHTTNSSELSERSGGSILIVDDEDQVRTVVCGLL